MKRPTMEEVWGAGAVLGTTPKDAPGPNGPGSLPTRRAIEKASGALIIVDDRTFDPAIHEELPGGGAQ